MVEVRVKPSVRILTGIGLGLGALVVLAGLVGVLIRQHQREQLLNDSVVVSCEVTKKSLNGYDKRFFRELQCPSPLLTRREPLPEDQIERPMVGEKIEVYYAKANPEVYLSRPPSLAWHEDLAWKEWAWWLGITLLIGGLATRELLKIRKQVEALKSKFYPATVMNVTPLDDKGWCNVMITFESGGRLKEADLMAQPGKFTGYVPGNTVYYVIEKENPLTVRLVQHKDLELEYAYVRLRSEDQTQVRSSN